MNVQSILETKVKEGVKAIFDADLAVVEFQPTRKDFEGDITVVVFPMLRVVKGNPEQIGNKIGEYLQEKVDEVTSFNTIKGFLNIVVDDKFYLEFFNSIREEPDYGFSRKPIRMRSWWNILHRTRTSLCIWGIFVTTFWDTRCLRYLRLPERRYTKRRLSMIAESIFAKVCWRGRNLAKARLLKAPG